MSVEEIVEALRSVEKGNYDWRLPMCRLARYAADALEDQKAQTSKDESL